MSWKAVIFPDDFICFKNEFSLLYDPGHFLVTTPTLCLLKEIETGKSCENEKIQGVREI